MKKIGNYGLRNNMSTKVLYSTIKYWFETEANMRQINIIRYKLKH